MPGARRCAVCLISFPPDVKYQDCPVCSERTQYYASLVPDEVWAWKASLLLQEAKVEKQVAEEIPAIDVEIKPRDGHLWANSWDMYRQLYRRLDEGDLFRIGDQVFEVVWYLHPRREYLVRGFSESLSAEDLSNLAGP